MAQQKFTVDVDKRYSKRERDSIAQDIIDVVVERSLKGISQDGKKKFPKYSKAYIDSPEFKSAGKSPGNVNLKLSFDMLTALGDYIRTKDSGKITIGYNEGSEENAKAEGNQKGTYGKKSPRPNKARRFMGITGAELGRILSKYPLRGKEADRIRLERILENEQASKKAEGVAGKVTARVLDDEDEEEI